MRSGDRDSDDVGRDDQLGQNIVPFPRDWLGPIDELVPISTTARGRAIAAAEAARNSGAAEAGEIPAEASAFWSEHSAALHSPVPSPAPGARRRPGLPRLRRFLGALPRRRAGAAVAVALLAVVALGLVGRLQGPGAAERHAPVQPNAVAEHISAAARASELAASVHHSAHRHAPHARRERAGRTRDTIRRAQIAVAAAHATSRPATPEASGTSTSTQATGAAVQSSQPSYTAAPHAYATTSPASVPAAPVAQNPAPPVTTVTTATYQAAPAGPSGPGGTVGGNCNPKCS